MKRAIWLAVPVLGLVELGAHLHFSTRVPEPEAWAALKTPVSELRKDGELVVVAPAWAEPVARQALGDELMPLSQVARPAAHRYARAIEISIAGLESPETAHWRQSAEQHQGPFRLRVLENPEPPRVQLDFVDALERASVQAGDAPCRWTERARVQNGGLGGPPTYPARRFECGGGQGRFVGVTVIDDENYAPRRCIWAPPAANVPLVLRYADVPLGNEIHGHAGFPWVMVRDTSGPPVRLEVRVAGRVVGVHEAHDQQGWAGFSFPVGSAGAQRAEVELRISADTTALRPFCFYADSR